MKYDQIAITYLRQLTESTVTIHPATDSDIPDVLQLEKQFPNNVWRNASSFQKPDHQLHVAKSGNKTVGYILTRKEPDSTLVVKMLTDQKARGTGIGGMMLDHVINQGNPVSLNVRSHNDSAISLYKSKGFRIAETRPGYYSNGDDAYHMRTD